MVGLRSWVSSYKRLGGKILSMCLEVVSEQLGWSDSKQEE